MSNQSIPNDAPPSYSDATGSSSSARPNAASSNNARSSDKNHLNVPGTSKGHAIPPDRRRSMEDEMRPLPKGWVRSFDPDNHHQFFVDITKEPPRSIWVHPYDDPTYLSTLPSEERERIEQESLGRGHPTSKADLMYDHTDDEDDHHAAASPSRSAARPGQHELPPRPDDKGKKPLGRKLKDKLTGSTHEERVQDRERRAEEERQMYERHQRIRQAMAKAAQTGQPQLIGKDREGKDLYVEPPSYSGPYGYGGGGYGFNPYGSQGVYNTPNARYIRPSDPYSRPYGGGFGGGYGLPLALGGGLLGGMMIGDMGMGGFGGGGF